MACPVCNSNKTSGGGNPSNFVCTCYSCGASFGRRNNVPFINGTEYSSEKEANAAYAPASSK